MYRYNTMPHQRRVRSWRDLAEFYSAAVLIDAEVAASADERGMWVHGSQQHNTAQFTAQAQSVADGESADEFQSWDMTV